MFWRAFWLVTVSTRAIDLRTVLLRIGETEFNRTKSGNIHLGQLGRRAASDLLHPQCEKLTLQLIQLLCQIIPGPDE